MSLRIKLTSNGNVYMYNHFLKNAQDFNFANSIHNDGIIILAYEL